MKIVFFVLLLKYILVAANVMLPESTVAVVNGIAISEDELNKEVGKLLPKTYFHSTLDEKKMQVLKDKALEATIEKSLLYRYALSKNLSISDEELDNKIEALEKLYKPKEMFDAALKRMGHTKASFRKAVRQDEVLQKLYKKEIEANFSDDDLRNYYETNIYKFKEPEKIRASLIYVRNDPTDPKGQEKARKKIEEAKKLLDSGENFAYIAQTYSSDPSRVKGGDMGFIHRGRLDKTIEDEAFSMDVNTTSGIIEKNIGYYIVRVEEKKKQNQLKFEDIKAGLRADLKRKEEEKRKSALLKKLFSTAVIVK